MKYSELTERGFSKQSFQIAAEVGKHFDLDKMRLEVCQSWGNSRAVCLTNIPTDNGMRIAGAKASGGPVLDSWTFDADTLLQVLFTREQLNEIAKALLGDSEAEQPS